MKRAATVALVLWLTALLCAGGLSEGQTALDAFNALMAEGEATQEARKSEEAWLDEILSGQFAQGGDGEALAAALEPLCQITDKAIAAYASAHSLKVAQVRNAYYKALAGALGAQIALHPASEGQYRNALTILSLFLEPEADADADASRAEVRAQMTPQSSQKIAEESALPVGFVEFVIMDEDWDDASWENDEAWRGDAGWQRLSEDSFDDIPIGSRDADGDTRIADMQAALISLGYLKGKADGVFGPRTQAALLEFQSANGLRASGAYSAADRDRLSSPDAVARWDYGEDFWDSDDFDSYKTPESPDTDTPETPKKRSASQRDTDDSPDTPKKKSSKKSSSKKDSPDSPDTD